MNLRKILIFAFTNFILMNSLLGFINSQTSFEAKDVPQSINTFYTASFKIIEQINPELDRFIYEDTISLKPSFGMLKVYNKEDVLEFKNYIVANREVWLYVYSKDFHYYKMILIDDGFDGFVYEREDPLFDRVAFVRRGRLVLPTITYKDQQIEFELPVDNKLQKIVITQKEYLHYLRTTLKILEEEWNPFIPFAGSSIKVFDPPIVEENRDHWKLVIYPQRNAIHYISSDQFITNNMP